MIFRRRNQVKSRVNKEDVWIKQYWRPAVAWQYLAVCIFDFIIAPILTVYFSYKTGTNYTQWSPLTLQASGFYHLSMGAIIGVAAWTRGQEKIQRIYNGHGLNEGYSEYSSESEYARQTPIDTNGGL